MIIIGDNLSEELSFKLNACQDCKCGLRTGGITLSTIGRKCGLCTNGITLRITSRKYGL